MVNKNACIHECEDCGELTSHVPNCEGEKQYAPVHCWRCKKERERVERIRETVRIVAEPGAAA